MNDTLPASFHFSLAKATEGYEIKHFLKRHKQKALQQEDSAYLIRFENSIIGFVKLIPLASQQNDCFWLRELLILEAWRHQKLGSQLLQYVLNDLQTRFGTVKIIAFPYAHLQHFYAQNGYQDLAISELPAPLHKQYTQALDQRKKWLCMVHTTAMLPNPS